MSHFAALPFLLRRSDDVIGEQGLTAADLRTFEELAGTGALRLKHPAELIVRIRGSDRAAAQEFAAELELALAERELRAADVPAAVSRTAPVRKQIPLAKADPS